MCKALLKFFFEKSLENNFNYFIYFYTIHFSKILPNNLASTTHVLNLHLTRFFATSTHISIIFISIIVHKTSNYSLLIICQKQSHFILSHLVHDRRNVYASFYIFIIIQYYHLYYTHPLLYFTIIFVCINKY